MSEIEIRTIRNAEIIEITRIGEDTAMITMANGNDHEIRVDDILGDWLFLHKKYREESGNG